MTLDPTVWTDLEAEPAGSGLVYRRLHPDSAHDLRAAIDRSDRRRRLIHHRAWLEEDDRLLPLPRSRAVDAAHHVDRSARTVETTVTLTDDTYEDVFTTLVGDVAEATARSANSAAAAAAFADRLWRWHDLLDALGDQGLPAPRRRGLFGELTVLEELITGGLDPGRATAAWTGPTATNQDFQLDHAAVEVKTTSVKTPRTLTIENERQLDDTGVAALFLVHISLDERRGGSGTSLNSIRDRITELCAGAAPADRTFNERLHRAGYLPNHSDLYDEPRYTVRHRVVYRVTQAFPRITEMQLPIGVGDVQYHINLVACGDHQISEAELTSTILNFPDQR